MFDTFRYSKTTQNYEHVKLSSDDNVDARGYTLVACDPCRARKLKCNGDRKSCDRCLASPSSICTYIGRKGPRQPRITNPSASSPSQSRREKPECLTRQGQATESASSNASSTSDSRSATFALSPSTSMTVVEPLPTQSYLDFPWELLDSFAGLGQPEQGQTIQYPNVDMNRSLLDDIQLPIPPATWTPEDLHDSPEVASQTNQGIRHWDREFAFQGFVDKQPEQARQMNSQATPVSLLDSSQLVGEEAHCTCLNTITRLLEDMDVGVVTTEIDTLLMCLARGIKSCSNVVACSHCNTCVDNAMLLASTAQQLVPTAKEVSSRLLLGRHEGRVRDDHSWASCGSAETGDVVIAFGKYSIEVPEMKVRLLHKIILLHLEDLQRLLASIKERIAPTRGAWGILVDAESRAAEIHWVIQELSK